VRLPCHGGGRTRHAPPLAWNASARDAVRPSRAHVQITAAMRRDTHDDGTVAWHAHRCDRGVRDRRDGVAIPKRGRWDFMTYQAKTFPLSGLQGISDRTLEMHF